MSITGVKTTPVIYKFQRMCVTRFTKVRVVCEASRFRVKLLQTDPYFGNHIWHVTLQWTPGEYYWATTFATCLVGMLWSRPCHITEERKCSRCCCGIPLLCWVTKYAKLWNWRRWFYEFLQQNREKSLHLRFSRSCPFISKRNHVCKQNWCFDCRFVIMFPLIVC